MHARMCARTDIHSHVRTHTLLHSLMRWIPQQSSQMPLYVQRPYGFCTVWPSEIPHLARLHTLSFILIKIKLQRKNIWNLRYAWKNSKSLLTIQQTCGHTCEGLVCKCECETNNWGGSHSYIVTLPSVICTVSQPVRCLPSWRKSRIS